MISLLFCDSLPFWKSLDDKRLIMYLSDLVGNGNRSPPWFY